MESKDLENKIADTIRHYLFLAEDATAHHDFTWAFDYLTHLKCGGVFPTVSYDVCNLIALESYKGWLLNTIFQNEHKFSISTVYGLSNLRVSGTWTSRNPIDSITIKAPSILEKAYDAMNTALEEYYHCVSNARKKFNELLLQEPELFFYFIPLQQDLEVQLVPGKNEEVIPYASLCLSTSKYTHLLALWNRNTGDLIPLESITTAKKELIPQDQVNKRCKVIDVD